MIGGKLIRCQNALKWYTYTLSFTMKDRAASFVEDVNEAINEDEQGYMSEGVE